MKLLAFTDLHLSSLAFKKIKEKIGKYNPDLLVCAGDITIFENNIGFILNKLDRLGKKILLIHGNHETDSVLKALCRRSRNITFIHKSYYKTNTHLFLGYGGSGFALIEPSFYRIGEAFAKIIKENKNKKIIFVTHAPPYGTKLDLIVTSHCGNKTLRNFIFRNKVDLHICGHLHENFGKEDKLKKTRIINPGPYGKVIMI